MKKYLIYGLCVFTGIALVIGLRAASAATPTVAPPGGNVTPTFSGLNVTNGATITDLGVSKTFAVVGKTTLIGDTEIIDGNLGVSGILDVNTITSSLDTKVTVAKDLHIGGNLQLNGNSVVQDSTVLGTSTVSGNLIGPDNIVIDGGVINLKGGRITSNSIADIPEDGVVYVWDNQPVEINDNLKVTGSTTVNVSLTTPKIVGGVVSTINGVSTPNLTVEGNLISTGSVHATDYLSTDNWLQTDKYLAVGEYAQIDGNLRVKGKIKNDLAASTPVTFSDTDGVKIEATGMTGVIELDVEGDLKADTIGSYGEKSSGKITVIGNSSNKTDTPACDSGGVIVDCGMKNYRFINGSYAEVDYDFTVHSIYADKSNNKCTVKAKNTNAGTRYLEAIAVCFYPGY